MELSQNVFGLNLQAKHLRRACFASMKLALARKIEGFSKTAQMVNERTDKGIKTVLSELDNNSLSGTIDVAFWTSGGCFNNIKLVIEFKKFEEGENATLKGWSVQAAAAYVAAYYALGDDAANFPQEAESLKEIINALLSATSTIRGIDKEMVGFITETLEEHNMRKEFEGLLKAELV